MVLNKGIVVILLLIISIILISGCTSNAKEYRVGNSSFTIPGEFKEMNSSGYYTEYGGTMELNYSGNVSNIMVLEFDDKSKMDTLLDKEFDINNKTTTDTYYEIYNKTIGNTTVQVIDDRKLAARTYLFEKNGNYYMIDIFFKKTSDRSDYPGSAIIQSMKSSKNFYYSN